MFCVLATINLTRISSSVMRLEKMHVGFGLCAAVLFSAPVFINSGSENTLDSLVRRSIPGLYISEGDEEPGHPVQISGPPTLRLSISLPGTSGGERCCLHVSVCVCVCVHAL